MAQIGCEVYTIELLEELTERAKEILFKLKYNNVQSKCGNGYEGWAEHAPFDAIIVTAAPDKIPEALIEQLKNSPELAQALASIAQTKAV